MISKKHNVPIRIIYDIVAKYRKCNSTIYFPKDARLKKNFWSTALNIEQQSGCQPTALCWSIWP